VDYASYTGFFVTHIEPVLPLLLLTATLGFVPTIKKRCRGRNILTPIALLGLFCWSFPPLAKLQASLLDGRYSVGMPASTDAGAIVVLSGGLDELPALSRTFAETSTYRRALHAAWLYRQWKPLPVLATGGRIGRAPDAKSASEVMQEILRNHGVPEDQIWIEEEARSTYENALYSSQILKARGISRIVLVSDGVHLLRSELCFRKQGLTVTDISAWNDSEGALERWYDYLPTRTAIEINESCLHEWIGLIYYWARGYI